MLRSVTGAICRLRLRLLPLLLVLCAGSGFQPAAGVSSSGSGNGDVHHLDLTTHSTYTSLAPVGFRTLTLQIYCFPGTPRHIQHTFRTIRLRLQLSAAASDAQFAQYVGSSPAAVRQHYEAKRSLFSWAHLFSAAGATGNSPTSDVRLAAFNSTCVGIETSHAYTVRLHVVRLDLLRFAMFAAGVVLLISAHRLTRMPFFYYSSGVGLGISLSVFLIVWLVARQLPKKSLMLTTVLGGWALLWYCLQSAWDNAQALLAQHQMWVFYYVCAAGLISFVACYRIGPPTNQRSVDIVRWVLQLAAVALIYGSSEYAEVTVASCAALMLWYYLPLGSGWRAVKRAYRRRFPAARRLLSAEEFEEQGREMTRRELAKMLEFCGSPEAKPWQTVARLRDPKRFAEFVERGVHVTEEEQFDHTQSLLELRDDGSESEDGVSETDDESGAERRQQQQVPKKSPATAPEISDDEDEEVASRVQQQGRRTAAGTPPAFGWRLPPAIAVPIGGAGRNGAVARRKTPASANHLAEISSDDE